jgi:hypothetical protein
MAGPANGTAVNFGYTGAGGITITGIAGTLLQSSDLSAEADKDEVRQLQGDIVSRNWYDQHYKATLEWVVSGTGIAVAITNSTIAPVTPGTIIVISACASQPDLVATNWECMSGASAKKSVTGQTRFSVPVEKRAGITAAQSA